MLVVLMVTERVRAVGSGSLVMSRDRSLQEIAAHSARDVHACWAQTHSAQGFRVRDYLD